MPTLDGREKRSLRDDKKEKYEFVFIDGNDIHHNQPTKTNRHLSNIFITQNLSNHHFNLLPTHNHNLILNKPLITLGTILTRQEAKSDHI